MKFSFKKMMGVGSAAMVALSLLVAPVTMAWGPEDRPTYTMNAPADHATFNSITDSSAIGDERQFVKVVEDGVGDTYSDDLMIAPGKRYRVYIYYHNDASETYNDKAHNQVGVAMETRLMSSFPDELKKNERQAIVGRISSTTTTPEAVWDEAYVTAKEALTLHYIQGSAKIYNHWYPDGKILSTNLFSKEGTFLGTSELNGIIYGCDKFAGSVSYVFETKAVATPENPENPENPPVDPEKPETPVDPVVPEELPHTGPIEIVFVIIVVGLIVAGIIYWSKTHKAVKKATKRARGKK